VRLLDKTREPDFQVIETSWMARNDLLALLAEADMRGRVSRDTRSQEAAIQTTQLFREYAEELGRLKRPRPFPSGLARFHYFSTDGRSGADYAPFDDSVGEAVLMCGLPASGKNTWVAAHAGEAPIVELDAVRREMGVSPDDNQSEVIQAAKEKARVLMRKKTPRFIWNATNLRVDLRRPLITLFGSTVIASVLSIAPPTVPNSSRATKSAPTPREFPSKSSTVSARNWSRPVSPRRLKSRPSQ
jgi:hypothetical protein